MSSGIRKFGVASAAAAVATSLGYAVPQLLQVAGLLDDPWDRIFIFAPSLLLAPSFVCAMAAAMELVEIDRRAMARAAFGLACVYATLVSIVYVVQLAVVIPRELSGDAAAVAMLKCCSPRMPFTAIDLLGYSLMSVATGLLAGALAQTPQNAWLRRALSANGWLGFSLIGQFVWPELIYIGALWLVTFPAAMIFLWRRFRLAG